jgi:hypothetical protein
MSRRYWPVEQPWRRPSRCETGGCITPTRHGGHVQFTSDQNPHGQLRGYATVAEVAQMIDEVKAGKWDHLVAGDE